MVHLSNIAGKSALKSLSVWGGIIGVVASGAEIVREVAQDPTIMAILPSQAVPYVTAIGSIIAILGRLAATRQITGVVKAKT